MQIGTGKRPPRRTAAGAQRVERMIAMYREGLTCGRIGVRASLLGSGLGYTVRKGAQYAAKPFQMQGPGGVTRAYATAAEARAAYLTACREYAAKHGLVVDSDSELHSDAMLRAHTTPGHPYPAPSHRVLAGQPATHDRS